MASVKSKQTPVTDSLQNPVNLTDATSAMDVIPNQAIEFHSSTGQWLTKPYIMVTRNVQFSFQRTPIK